MAVDVVIRKKGIFKKNLKIEDIIFENMGYGIMDDNFRLSEGETGEVTVLYNKNIIGRGLEVVLQKDCVELRLPLPASEEDIKFFYQYIEKICKILKTDQFERNEEVSFLDRVNDYIKWDISASIGALNHMEQAIEKGEYENMYVFGAINPISIGKRELEIIDEDLNKFGQLLHELQSMDAYYAGAQVYQRDNGTIFGMYAVTEDLKTIFPFKPSLIMNNEITINEWFVTFGYDDEVQGSISFDNLISNVEKENIYDSEHFIFSLGKEKMKELIDKYGTKV